MTTDEEASFFKEEVQKDPEVCNNCFRRCRHVWKPTHWLEPITVEEDEQKVDTVVVSRVRDSVPVASRNQPILQETERDPVGSPCRCGSFNVTTVTRNAGDALTKRECLLLADRLADRIEEKASGFNREAFIKSVNRLKSDEKLSNQDDEIFRRATEQGIDG